MGLIIYYFLLIQSNYLLGLFLFLSMTFLQIGVVNTLMFVLTIVLSATYLSLLESHIIALVQQSVGPTTTALGILQPLADAFKLLMKEPTRPYKSYAFIFSFAPIYTFTVAIMIWAVLPLTNTFVYANLQYNLLFMLFLFTLNNYGMVFGAWSSQNKYAVLSGYRTIALTSSYGISLSLILWYPAVLAQSYNLQNIVETQEITLWFIMPGLPLALLYWIMLLTEIKKIPFDVTESEAELGSGYLVEYSGMGFALFMISEYSYILMFMTLFVHCFLGGWLYPTSPITGFIPYMGCFIYGTKTVFCLLIYLLMSGSVPNYSFDFIMSLHWRCLFPILLMWVCCSVLCIISI